MSTPWFTAAELAGLPGMPGSEFRTRAKLVALGVPSRLRTGREGGGGREFDAAGLPAETRAALLLLQAVEAPKPAPEPAPQPAESSTQVSLRNCAISQVAASARPPSLADAACADARATLVQQLAQLVPLCGGVTKACAQLVQQVNAGVASPELLQAAKLANLRPRGDGPHLSQRSLMDFHTAHRDGGWHALLPKASAPAATAVAEDVAAVLKRYASTAGSSRNLTHVAQAVNLDLGRPFDDWRRLYDRARRVLPKLDRARLIKARHTGAERAALLPFQRRDKSGLRPLDVGVCDGHSFKAKVRHPDHGQPFTPEVTLIMDVATRRITGWSVSLSESTIAVGDAMRHSVGNAGVYALMYTDNGSGEKAKYFDCPVTGLFARLGTEHKTGRPRHPQGHGVIERSWQTHMIRAARQFATYSGSDADDGKYKDTAAALRKEQTALKKAREQHGADAKVVSLSNKCPSWQQFIDAVSREIIEYNSSHRHRGLPKHEAGPYGRLHYTPDEAWAAMLVAEDVHRLDAPALRAVFMPAKLATAIRGEVRFLNLHYYAAELVQYEGQRVSVRYDIHDPKCVWVWSQDGEFICAAQNGANSGAFFPKSVVDMAREKRVQASIRLRQRQIESSLAELNPTVPAIEAPKPAFIGDLVVPQREPLEVLQRVENDLQAPLAADARPFFESSAERYEWLMRHRAVWSDADSTWLAAYVAGDDYAGLHEYFAGRGIEWPREGEGDDTSFNQAG